MEPDPVSRQPACPDLRILQQYVSGALEAQAAESVCAHLGECRDCRDMVTELGGSPTLASSTAAGDAARRTTTGATPTLTEHKSEDEEDVTELPFLLPSLDPKAIGKIANYEVLRVLGRGGMGIVL